MPRVPMQAGLTQVVQNQLRITQIFHPSPSQTRLFDILLIAFVRAMMGHYDTILLWFKFLKMETRSDDFTGFGEVFDFAADDRLNGDVPEGRCFHRSGEDGDLASVGPREH